MTVERNHGVGAAVGTKVEAIVHFASLLRGDTQRVLTKVHAGGAGEGPLIFLRRALLQRTLAVKHLSAVVALY